MAYTLGLDIGSVTAGYVVLEENGTIIATGYRAHNGDPFGCVRLLLDESSLSEPVQAAAISSSPVFVKRARRYEDTVCWATAARRQHPRVRSLLVIGGERFGLLTFDAGGEYRRMKTNTSCAAGTGSFLDQQARRLHLSSGAALSELAEKNSGDLPVIASRCSVFAKTDIIHAQQEGYRLEEICDGICLGLARNAADVLFDDGKVDEPVVFIGGVALNTSVKRHLGAYLDTTFVTDDHAHLYGALGAAYCLQSENDSSALVSPLDIIAPVDRKKEYFFPRLGMERSEFPDFDDHKRYLYTPKAPRRDASAADNPVEVDCYEEPAVGMAEEGVIGFDIGSTSTKAAVCAMDGQVLAGFYTRTAGRPVEAVMGILEAIEEWLAGHRETYRVLGVATTGSGRKLSGAIIGADLILDEITAHARAAVELHPEVDTIIEIGGQDSKFTALKKGRVTFSKMNTVCAAGTGSFLEEQATRLDVKIGDYADAAMGEKAPLTSDRCTVFMERDINFFLHSDYSTREILAAAAHSVCENYLLKVASEGHIGSCVVFQGATAKNRALLAAFEQKLNTGIHVSRFCHLTGAVGAALSLIDDGIPVTAFRGLGLYKKKIPVKRKNCTLCRNNCRLTIATVNGERVAYGFLCGRDYETERFVSVNSSGLDLLAERAKVERREHAAAVSGVPPIRTKSVGIPAGLHLSDDLIFWRVFFESLGFEVIDSLNIEDAAKTGKLIAGAEFCAPMAAFHGHARYLAERADILFVPSYLETIHQPETNRPVTRKVCYYTQFAPVLIKSLEEKGGTPCILPVINPRIGESKMLKQLRQSLVETTGEEIEFSAVEKAFQTAGEGWESSRRAFRRIFADRGESQGGFEVVLLGRPYTVLQRSMNKGIPDVFGKLGIRAYFQDMLPEGAPIDSEISELLEVFPWDYAAKILEAAAVCASSADLYPVLLTSFKCAPDSFLIEYFSRIMDRFEKPYLILQLDEHASSVGYETRIEAAVRSFRNHNETHKQVGGMRRRKRGRSVLPELTTEAKGKVMLFPNWDPIASPLVVANLKWAGWDVRLLEETSGLIKESMKYNTGQCIPVHIIIHECAEYIRKHNLAPEKTMLWMAESKWACNIPMYPHYMKSMLDTIGGGMERVSVYLGTLLHVELPKPVVMRGYFAYLFAGLIRRLTCRIRPYERTPGESDRAAKSAVTLLASAFSGDVDFDSSLIETIRLFEAIEYDPAPRPKVAVFGDFYVRDNDVMNQDLVKCIEAAGGEVVTTPYSDYLRIVSSAYFKKWFKGHRFKELVRYRSMLAVVDLIERRFKRFFPDFVKDDIPVKGNDIEAELARFNVSLFHEGESYENLLKIMHIQKKHPDVALFVQTNPAFCCPSLITEAMSGKIERVTGVPVVTVTYDGTESFKNSVVVPYIHFARERMAKPMVTSGQL